MINERNSDKKERSAITLIDENSTVITGSVTYRRCGSLESGRLDSPTTGQHHARLQLYTGPKFRRKVHGIWLMDRGPGRSHYSREHTVVTSDHARYISAGFPAD